jgi:hypothetical protein
MSRKRALPLGILAAGLLGVLAAIGVVNGLWSKNLVVEGVVTTGDVNIEWHGPTCTDRNPWQAPIGLDPQGPPTTINGEYKGKDVAWTVGTINAQDDQVLDLEVHNGYPSYMVDCELEFQNTGTIPVNFAGFAIGWSSNLTGCEQGFLSNFYVLSCDQLTVVVPDHLGQVDPGDLETGSFKLHVEQPALQSTCTATGTGSWDIDPSGDNGTLAPGALGGLNCTAVTTYRFQVKACFAQWNEDPDGTAPPTGANESDFDACRLSPQHEGPGFDSDADGTPDALDTEVGIADQGDCGDGIDNDGDGLVDAADPGCLSP